MGELLSVKIRSEADVVLRLKQPSLLPVVTEIGIISHNTAMKFSSIKFYENVFMFSCSGVVER